jgi:hypothetical protein
LGVRQVDGGHVLDADTHVRRDALSGQGNHVWCPVDRVDMTSTLREASRERAGTTPDIKHVVQVRR